VSGREEYSISLFMAEQTHAAQKTGSFYKTQLIAGDAM
jgi:hypothetical protein